MPGHRCSRPSRDAEEQCPLVLSHYTSTAALKSMLKSPDGGLRLWDSATMSDPDEGRTTGHGAMLVEVLSDTFGEDSWMWRRYAAAHIGCFVGTTRGTSGAVGYRTIDAGDDLLFWRLYGDQCRGVSLTIPDHVCGPLLGQSVVHRVTYGDQPLIPISGREVERVLRAIDKLRTRALEAGEWPEIQKAVIRQLDQLFITRFLHKRSHYELEQEYRAVVFVGDETDDVGPSVEVSGRGTDVQGGVRRTWIQIPEFGCERIFTTASQINIGSNVPDAKNVKKDLTAMVTALGKNPKVIAIRISEIGYRPR